MQRSLAELLKKTATGTNRRSRPVESTEVTDGEVWIIFKGDIPLDDFLEKNKASKLNNGVIVAVSYAGEPKQRPTSPSASLTQMSALRQEWVEKSKSLRSVKPFHVQQLAKKYGKLSGKWLIYRQRSEIDATWTTIATAVVSGTLGYASKVFKSADEPATNYVICVYTKDFTNEEDVWAAEKRLRELGVTDSLCYKPDIYTVLGIYAGNEWGIRPSIYKSRACN